MRFKNREHAGELLAKQLTHYKQDKNTILLALPRGGVPVAHVVAKQLDLPLDVMLVRKLGMPGQEELAIGAIAWGDIKVFNESLLRQIAIDPETLEQIIQREQYELERRNTLYRKGKPAPDLNNKTVIIIDDGLATGATMRAAVAAVKALNPARTVVAVPVAPPETIAELEQDVDEVICLHMPDNLMGVGAWYDDFRQTSDEEVCELLS